MINLNSLMRGGSKSFWKHQFAGLRSLSLKSFSRWSTSGRRSAPNRFSTRCRPSTGGRPSARWMQGVVLSLIGLVWVSSFWFEIKFNTSKSLPHYCYFVQKGRLPAKGELVMFYHPLFTDPLIKRVEGVSGDKIEIKSYNVYVASRHVGPLVDKNSQGETLIPVEAKVVPEKHYFVAGDHRKSFDSCYEAFGLVHQSQVEGRAWPIF